MKKYEYMSKVYDSDSSLNFDLAKLGLAGWLLCSVVRYNPSPSRIQFYAWFVREILTAKGKSQGISKAEEIFKSPEVTPIQEIVPKIQGDGIGGINWPEFDPDTNPFDDLEDDFELPDEDK